MRRVWRLDPVHPVLHKGEVVGWQWGKSGKVYRSKEKAETQAKAIFARGWHEDARRDMRRLARQMQPPAAAERAYVVALRGILRGVHAGVNQVLEREVWPDRFERFDVSEIRTTEVRHTLWAVEATLTPRFDADTPQDRARRALNLKLKEKVAAHIRRQVPPYFDLMATPVKKRSDESMRLIGIPFEDAAHSVSQAVASARADNIALMENAGRDYVDDVRDVIMDPDNQGLRVEELTALVADRADVSLSRAELIATDQTLKLSSALNQARQRDAGVTSYRWSTSLDERVRPMHADLEGKTFDWDDPPITNEAGDTNHPGEDYRCRCVPIPILDEDEEPETSE